MPQDTRGRWGEQDERGALNLLTPEVVLEATRACTTGRVYPLGRPIVAGGAGMAYRPAPQRLTLLNHADDMLAAMAGGASIGANEDVLILPSHSGTHMDALCHVFAEGHMYNGFAADTFTTSGGARRCGIEHVGAIAARAVLFDVAVEALAPGHVITAEELQAVQPTPLEPGDVALIRTGAGGATAAQAGIGVAAAEWLAEHDVAAVGADNMAVEAIPFDGSFLAVHIALLIKRGITLIENLHLDDMAADGCGTGLFVAGPLLVRGASGSPVNPVVIG